MPTVYFIAGFICGVLFLIALGSVKISHHTSKEIRVEAMGKCPVHGWVSLGQFGSDKEAVQAMSKPCPKCEAERHAL